MTEDAGQIFKGLISEYKNKAKRTEQEVQGYPKPPGLGAFWFNSDTGILYIASLDEDGETIWQQMTDVMGPKPLVTDGPDELWV